MKVSFYKYTGERSVINKTLPTPKTVDGRLTGFDLRHPEIVVRSYDKSQTYCYVDFTNRYYFIDSVRFDGDKAFLSLSCDVLTTFKEQILNATGEIYATDRPFNYDGNYKPVCDVRTEKKKVSFPVVGLTETGSIVMITIKGNK